LSIIIQSLNKNKNLTLYDNYYPLHGPLQVKKIYLPVVLLDDDAINETS
jgi:hypothetical protein